MSLGRRVCVLVLGLLLILITAKALRGEVWVEVDGLWVDLFHTGAEFQCAAEIVGNLEIEGSLAMITEEDVSETPANCICDFDLRFGFELPAPSFYLLQLRSPHPPYLLAEFWIDAAGATVGLSATVDQSDCGGWATGIPNPPTPSPAPSFSAIKSRY